MNGSVTPEGTDCIDALLTSYATACASRDVVKLPQLARNVFDQPHQIDSALQIKQQHQQEIWARIIGCISRGSLGLVSMYLLDSKRVSGDSALTLRQR